MKNRGLLFEEKFKELPWDAYGLDWSGDLSEPYGNIIEHEDKIVFINYSIDSDEIGYVCYINEEKQLMGMSNDFNKLNEFFETIINFLNVEKNNKKVCR